MTSVGRRATDEPERKKKLVLTVEVDELYCDDLDDSAAIWADLGDSGEPTPQDYLDVVLEEWVRPEGTIWLVFHPGEKCMNDDFEIRAYPCRIVGAATL